MSDRARSAACLLATLLVVAAAAHAATRHVPVPLIQATAEVPEEQLLDVGVIVFGPGVPAESEDPDVEEELAERGVFREVRRGEARFFPVLLAGALQDSGHWGAVRVIPSGTDTVDVNVSGSILESTGRELALEIAATDASGRRWLERRYRRRADPRAYAETVSGEESGDRRDPFASLYNEIANDLLAARNRLDPGQMRELRQISYLRFASDLAPAVFGDYLRRGRKGRIRTDRLPADDDPMVERVSKIRERDFLLVDTLNEQYLTFFGEMEEPYSQWRAYSYEEEMALAKLRRQARAQKILGAVAILGGILADGDDDVSRAGKDAAVIAGTMAVRAGMAKAAEARIHREAIKELAASFDSEVAPMVVEVEGRTLRLHGSAETQYAAWRELLKQLMASETGIPFDPDTPSTLVEEGTLER